MCEAGQLYDITQGVMYFVAFKLQALPKLIPVDESTISLELVENMRKIVWVERYIFIADSAKFMREHNNRMISRGDLHVLYSLYLCHLTKKCFSNAYEVFVRTMTLLFTLVFDAPSEGYLEAVALAATVFAHYHEVYRTNFNKQGGFENLNEYLLQRDTLKQYSKLQKLETAREPRSEIVKKLKLQTTRLKVYLSKDFKTEDIESHRPSICLMDMILRSGSGSIRSIVYSGMNDQDPQKVEVEKKSKAVGDSAKPSNSDKNQQLKQGQTSSESTKIGYFQVMKHVREFSEKIQHLEQLLDFIFEDTSSNDGGERK